MKIEGFPAYEAYADGRVLNINTGRQLKFEKTQNGYLRVTLSARGETKRFLVHRLIAQVFLPNPSVLPCVNHKDGMKTNNMVGNLEWCSHSENEIHSYGVLGKQAVSGEAHYNIKFTDADCERMRAMRAAGDSCRYIAGVMKCSHQHVSDVTRGIKRAG